MRRQIISRGIRFARGATGPYARRLGQNTHARACGRRKSGGGLWTDNPDDVGAGWTNNGDGTYTCDGTDGTSVSQSAAIQDGATYSVSLEISGYVGGTVTVYLGGNANFGVTTDLSGDGTYQENVTISIPGAAPNLISIDSNTFNGTVGNISVNPV